MADREVEIFKEFKQSQNKYTYFLLAAAASAIALSLKRTEGLPLTYSMVLLGLAILSWGVSFYCGCTYLRYLGSSLYTNFVLIRVQKGSHPWFGQNTHVQSVAADAIKEALKSNSEKASKFADFQFRLLIGGALLYIAYHITDMVVLTIHGAGS